MSAPRFDEEAYQDGRRAFGEGLTLRQLAERIAQADDDEDAKAMSFAIGFGDGVLDLLRTAARPMVLVDPGVMSGLEPPAFGSAK